MEQNLTWGIVAFLLLKEFVGMAGKFIGRRGESVLDHETRIAVAFEKLQVLSDKVAVIERDQRSQWQAIDRVKGDKK